MSPTEYFLTLGIFFGTILLIFAMRYYSAVQQAKARLANDQAYQEMADRAAGSQAETASAVTAIQATLADVATRLSAIERVLKEVE